jgi:hypothetical protein
MYQPQTPQMGGMDMGVMKQWVDWYHQMVQWVQQYGPELTKQQANSQEKVVMQQFQSMLQQYGQTITPTTADKTSTSEYHIQQMPVSYKETKEETASTGKELENKKDLAKAAVAYANIQGVNVEYKEPVELPEHLKEKEKEIKKDPEPDFQPKQRKQKLGIKGSISAANKKDTKPNSVQKQIEDAISAKRKELEAAQLVSHKSLMEQEKERLRHTKEKIASEKKAKEQEASKFEMYFVERGTHEPPKNPVAPKKSILKKRKPEPEPLPEELDPPTSTSLSLASSLTLGSLTTQARAMKEKSSAQTATKDSVSTSQVSSAPNVPSSKPSSLAKDMYDPFEAEDSNDNSRSSWSQPSTSELPNANSEEPSADTSEKQWSAAGVDSNSLFESYKRALAIASYESRFGTIDKDVKESEQSYDAGARYDYPSSTSSNYGYDADGQGSFGGRQVRDYGHGGYEPPTKQARAG